MARRQRGAFDLIVSAPWPFAVALGIIAFVGMRYGSVSEIAINQPSLN